MFCRKCGKEISDDSLFCCACGEKVYMLENLYLNSEIDDAGESVFDESNKGTHIFDDSCNEKIKSMNQNECLKNENTLTPDCQIASIQGEMEQNNVSNKEISQRKREPDVCMPAKNRKINKYVFVCIGIVAVVLLIAIISISWGKAKKILNGLSNINYSTASDSVFEDGLFISEYKGDILPSGYFNNSCSIYRIDMTTGKSTKISHFEAMDEDYNGYYYGLGEKEGHDISYQKASIVFKVGGSQHVGWIDTKGNITDISEFYIGEIQDDFYGNVTHSCPKFDSGGYFYFLDSTKNVVVRTSVDNVEHNDFEVVAEDIRYSFHFTYDGTITENNENANGKDISSSDIWLLGDEYISHTDGFPLCIAENGGNYGAYNIQYTIIPSVKGQVNESPTLSPDLKEIAFLSYLEGEGIVNLYTAAIAPNQTPQKIDTDLKMSCFYGDNSQIFYSISEWRGTSNGKVDVDAIEQGDGENNKELKDDSNSLLEDGWDEPSLDTGLTENGGEFERMVIYRGELPDSLFEEIKGHYADESGDTVDIDLPSGMVRFILGGNQSHAYYEKISGYSVNDSNDYYIYVESGNFQYTYWYTGEMLYVNFEDGWDPMINNFDYTIQCYSKVLVDANQSITNDVEVDALNEIIMNQEVTIGDLMRGGYKLSLYLDHTKPGMALPYRLYEFGNTGVYAVVYDLCPGTYEPNENERVYLVIETDDPEDSYIYDYFNLLLQNS